MCLNYCEAPFHLHPRLIIYRTYSTVAALFLGVMPLHFNCGRSATNTEEEVSMVMYSYSKVLYSSDTAT